MICQEILPSLQLRAFVKSYQLRHFVFSHEDEIPFKPYAPRPEQTLAFYPRGSESVEYCVSGQFLQRPRSVLMGQACERTNRHLHGSDFLVILVNFQPGGLFKLTGIPSELLTNSFIDAEAVFSSEIRLLNERLNSSDDYDEMIGLVEAFLFDLIKNKDYKSDPLDVLTDMLIRQPENKKVIQLAESSFLSTRQFERRFKQRTGVSPKFFTRICRLTKSLSLKYNQPELDWLSISLECGYSDYQHLARDYKELAASTPVNYVRAEHHAPERHFGLRDSSL
jgi:AraC-like DNA-binding protein